MTAGTAGHAPGTDSESPSPAPLLLREVNERIREMEHGRSIGLYDLVCECGDETCTAAMRITADEYEAVRAEDGVFAVLPGHERPEDDVVKRSEGYVAIRVGRDVSAISRG